MDACGSVWLMLVAVFLVALPSAYARKCYVCDSLQNLGCADANQISQLYTDCSTGGGGYGGSFGGQQPYPGGGVQPGNQFGQPNQFGGPQQLGQQGGNFGGVGGGYGGVGGDRCVKYTIVGNGLQPQVVRRCGSNGIQGDGCIWQGNTQICTCNWNYCNGSSRLSTASTSALLLAGLVTALSHFYRNSL